MLISTPDFTLEWPWLGRNKSIFQYLLVLHSPNLHQLFIFTWSTDTTWWFVSLTYILQSCDQDTKWLVPNTIMSSFKIMFLIFRYEKEGKGRKTIKAQQLWYAIIESQTETGTPYMLYKDHCNRKSNQQNLGTIKCSNLCTEIVEYSSPDEVSTEGVLELISPGWFWSVALVNCNKAL